MPIGTILGIMGWGELLSSALRHSQEEEDVPRITEEEGHQDSEELRGSVAETRRLMQRFRADIQNSTEVRHTEYGNSMPLENPPTMSPGEVVEVTTPEDFIYIPSRTTITSTTATSNIYIVDEDVTDYPDTTNWNMETEEWEIAEPNNSCNGKCGLMLCEECMEDPRRAISF